MELKEYRQLKKLSRREFGELVGVCGIQVWRWETGVSMPKPEKVKAIMEASKGAVTAEDLHAAVQARKDADVVGGGAV